MGLMMAEFFNFEIDFIDSFRCIPMLVRYKLDTSGIKLKLSQWSLMTQDERKQLVNLPCHNEEDIQAYRDYLQKIIFQHTGLALTELPIDPQPPWINETEIPINIENKLQQIGAEISLKQWSALNPLQRFALIKLSQPGHENKNFPKALAEFNLLV
jgi:hypothetical protein